jgi:hypothetical protein
MPIIRGSTIATAVVELLMMGMRMPKTRWALFKRQVISLKNCCIWLVDSFECRMMHGLANTKYFFNICYSDVRKLLWFATCGSHTLTQISISAGRHFVKIRIISAGSNMERSEGMASKLILLVYRINVPYMHKIFILVFSLTTLLPGHFMKNILYWRPSFYKK